MLINSITKKLRLHTATLDELTALNAILSARNISVSLRQG